MTTARPVGELLRDWRQRRHMSQLALAVEANLSTRHLSFVESGRSAPSREMILHLSEHLDSPLEVSLSELAIEAFYPADTATAEGLAARAATCVSLHCRR